MLKIQDNYRFLLYLPSLLFAVIAALSFYYQPFNYYLLLITSFGIIPILEFILSPSRSQSTKSPGIMFDLILYMIPIIQYALLIWFLFIMKYKQLSTAESIGLISSMGILCGVYGINAAHELGHRIKASEQFLSKALLLTSLYLHFHIEHNRGHHKKVGTLEDPATARKNEGLYRFWLRCISSSYLSAYKLEANRLKARQNKVWSIHNSFIKYQFIQLVFLIIIWAIFGLKPLLFFMASAFIGILLLETINYVEHYGLKRQSIGKGIYERVLPVHSWNSDHVLGRYMLFELTRHSDHHNNSLRKYPKLESIPNSPQLPAGYPAMMILAMFPFAFKKVMNKRLIATNG